MALHDHWGQAAKARHSGRQCDGYTRRIPPFAGRVENASHAIFGKPTAELDAEESARLKALLYGPSVRNDPDRWAARSRVIADRISTMPQ